MHNFAEVGENWRVRCLKRPIDLGAGVMMERLRKDSSGISWGVGMSRVLRNWMTRCLERLRDLTTRIVLKKCCCVDLLMLREAKRAKG